ncbi:hypothetical protein [Flagellimonas beolgyonensis]|uniref:hypothetical protein n=1 Tax=Flagellimonas beolgyonensis TaxID=864064 RepID=UPI000F8DC612|nr:hypothetical protein [Allomuricauda beolgyonensis]
MDAALVIDEGQVNLMKNKLTFVYLTFALFGGILLNEDESLRDEIKRKSFLISVEDSKSTMPDQWIGNGIKTQGLMRLKNSSNDTRDM